MRTNAVAAMLAVAMAGTAHSASPGRQVQRITYANVGASGQYNEVVSMDQETGECRFAPRNISGPLAPFNEPLSLHFRGPLNLKQVAVYLLDSTTSTSSGHKQQQQDKRDYSGGVYVSWPNSSAIAMPLTMTMTTTTRAVAPDDANRARDRQSHECQIMQQAQELGVEWYRDCSGGDGDVYAVDDDGDLVELQLCAEFSPTTALSSGSVITGSSSSSRSLSSSGSTTFQPSTPTPSSSSSFLGTTDTLLTTTAATIPTSTSRSHSVIPISAPSTDPASNLAGSTTSATDTPGKFVRTGYYNAAQQKAEGVMFLGNYGGQGSGKFTYAFGNTLSYVNADGTGGASSPTILKDTTLASSHEVTLLTNETCDASCGYVQPGSVAYKGFPGPSRIFLLEFSMPHHLTTTPFPSPFPSPSAIPNPQEDVPAIWLLNARIPHTAQYHRCNCWASGCGEIDVFEVLTTSLGDIRDNLDKAKSTVHHNNRGGGAAQTNNNREEDSDPNYFARPVDVDRPVRVAVVLDALREEWVSWSTAEEMTWFLE
ncbi:putative TOS1-like glycosyl hydrolase-domain-containing protein [Chaetomium strumarium]|uniref:glucan endo-1,3-beta-D-glucosidase n=1 Tax=Chaetomium strumarium TaxID=1170767 RepID=A0AAJ0H2I4_9PEZI|nr:putative TOS1-like glycosyl hydrolase-domain-containing protein [Chaetomium strumarium]